MKWTATVAAAGLVALLLFTCLFAGNWQPRPGVFRAIEPGYFCLEEVPPMPAYGWHRTQVHPLRLAVWFGFYDGPLGSWIAAPVLGPALVACVIGALMWRLEARARRRAGPNLCARCGYDREGLTAGTVCPECGAPPS